MINIIRFLKPYKLQVVLGPIFKLVEAIFELIVPLLMAKIIDTGIRNQDVSYILRYGLLIVFIGIIGLLSTIICQYFAAKASQGFGTNLRNGLFKHINNFSHSELDRFKSSTLITRITNDINQLQLAVAMFIRLAIRAPFLIIGSIIMAINIDAKISTIFIVSAIFISITIYLVTNKSVPFLRNVQKKLDNLTSVSNESLSGIKVIKAFAKQQWSESRFNKINDDITEISCKASKISSLLNPTTYVIINLSIALIIWFGGIRTNSGTLTQGEIIALINYMTQILLALIVVSNLIVIFTKAFASSERINEIFNTQTSIKSYTNNKVESKDRKIKILFDNVSFAYDKSKPIISNVNISIYAGEHVGIIGGTGSGKSTFINLIPRFYEASAGNVYVDGVNVKNYDIKELRDKIAIVHQNVVLFSGTIKENLLLGSENADTNTLLDALQKSQAIDFVNNRAKRLQGKVEQYGKNFSGGQRQRLTIARALIKNSEILILDDCTSALDNETESKITKTIINDLADKTVIIVSQKSKSVKHCDKIIVFDNGKIVGMGKHEELVNSCDIYKEICNSQNEQEIEI